MSITTTKPAPVQKPGTKSCTAAMKKPTTSHKFSSMKTPATPVVPPIKTSKLHEELWSKWTPAEKKVLEKLNTPEKIQLYLDNEIKYGGEDGCRSIRHTLKTKEAHCLGGSLLSYYLLTRHGYEAFCIGLEAVNDDCHAICVYTVTSPISGKKYYGSLSKSNFTLIRSRDAVYSSLRELVMSYWDFYFNTDGEKTLVCYTKPFKAFTDFKGVKGKEDKFSWMFNESGKDAKYCEQVFDEMDTVSLFPAEDQAAKKKMMTAMKSLKYDTRKEGKKQEHVSCFGKSVFTAPKILVEGGTLDSNPDGLYQC
ncbi:unnamed protein product [Amoebophrya sp. A120]|nr:unnamed protein product [Amoebophrya sp. A120]|eukprot:GSA120T00014325001.1